MKNNVTLNTFNYRGQISVPYSKSYLQRAIAISCLHPGTSTIIGITKSDDAMAALDIAKSIGAEVSITANQITIKNSANHPSTSISVNTGESGLSTRMFSPILASKYSSTHISGLGSILNRPMNMIIDALEKLGLEITSNNGKLPLEINGNIISDHISIDASETSQLLTGLIIAFSFRQCNSSIHVDQLKSIPYIQMTLDILADYGIQVQHKDYLFYTFKAFNLPQKKWTYRVEGDWSGAAFHIVGAAISGRIQLMNLNPISSQADRAILDAIHQCGARFSWHDNILFVEKHALNAFTFDASHCPDLFPPLAALAVACSGKSILIGTDRLTHKESNRALTIQEELKKLGIVVHLTGNEMHITGGKVSGGNVSSHNDHRIAMMLAILGTISETPIEIEGADAVNKSYPDFFKDIRM